MKSPSAAQYGSGLPGAAARPVEDLEVQDPSAHPEASTSLRVTTWNVLAPLMGSDKMFPGISRDIHSQEARRPILQRQFLTLRSDVVLLQEIRRSELYQLVQEGDEPLNGLYESHYVTDRSWQDLQVPDETERGVALLWRRGVLENVQTLTLELGSEGPPGIAIMRAAVRGWSEDVIFATAHLDGDSPVPAAARSQSQLLHVLDSLTAMPEASTCRAFIFGGDLNMTPYAPVMRELPRWNFDIASGCKRRPTCFSVLLGARFDHIFSRGCLEAGATEIPECPVSTCCPFAPLVHAFQVMFDCLGLTSPKVQVAIWRKCCLCLCVIPWLLGIICCVLCPCRITRSRCRWALEEWGSDHIPVTVIFRMTTCEPDWRH